MSTATRATDEVAESPTPSRPATPYRLLTLVLAVVASLLVGFAAGALTLRPAAAPGDDSAEVGFTRDMITHHDQAVEMGLIAYDRAVLPAVRQLGYDIATTQQGQIGMMHQWLRQWGQGPTRADAPMAWMPGWQNGDEAEGGHGDHASPTGLMPGMATSEQMRQLQEAEGAEVDRLFLELMIAHHLGGIHMVDAVLEMSDDPDVTWLAGLMEDGQQRELEVMRNLQSRLD